MRFMVIVCCALFLVLLPSNTQADTGIGVQFGEPGSVALSMRFTNLAIGAGWHLGDDGYLVADVDYWLLEKKLANKLDWFLGPGVGLRIGDPFRLDVRLPIGLQWMPTKDIEIFGQVAPALQIINETAFKFGGAVGIRYVF